MSRDDELRLLREYRLGRIVDQVFYNITQQKLGPVSSDEVAAVLKTTPEIVDRSRKLGHVALRTLIRCNNRLIFSIIKNMQLRGLGLDEMLRIGQVGLQEAMERHDPENGNRLATIAKHYIRGAVMTGLAEHLGLTDYAFRLMSKYRVMWHKLKESLGHAPSIYNLAEALNWTLKQTEKVAAISEKHRVKAELNTAAKVFASDSDSTLTWGDLIETEGGDVDTKMALDHARENEYLKLQKYLNPIEFKVIVLKYGLEDYRIRNNSQIAFECDMTVEDVREKLYRAKEKLKIFPESISLFHRVIERGVIDPDRGDGVFNLNAGVTKEDAKRDKFMHMETDNAMYRDELASVRRHDVFGTGAEEPDFELPNTKSEIEFTVDG